jgi:hypothetical protein
VLEYIPALASGIDKATENNNQLKPGDKEYYKCKNILQPLPPGIVSYKYKYINIFQPLPLVLQNKIILLISISMEEESTRDS